MRAVKLWLVACISNLAIAPAHAELCDYSAPVDQILAHCDLSVLKQLAPLNDYANDALERIAVEQPNKMCDLKATNADTIRFCRLALSKRILPFNDDELIKITQMPESVLAKLHHTLLANKSLLAENRFIISIEKSNPYNESIQDVWRFIPIFREIAFSNITFEGSLGIQSNAYEIQLIGDIASIKSMTVDTRYTYSLFNRNPNPANEKFIPDVHTDSTFISAWIPNPQITATSFKVDLPPNEVPAPVRKQPLSKNLDELPSAVDYRIRLYMRNGQMVERIIHYIIPYSC